MTGDSDRTIVADVQRWLVAVGFVLVAFAVSAALKRQWPGPRFLVFVPAIALAAWRCGPGPTALATALALVLIDWFFLPPTGSLAIASSTSVFAAIAFVALSAAIVGVVEALRRAKTLAEQRAKELESVSTRAGRLLEVTRALSDATAVEDVAAVVLDEGLSVLEAHRAVLVRVNGDRLDLIGIRGYAPEAEASVRRMAAEGDIDFPVTAAARTGEELWLRSAEELERRFPRFVATLDTRRELRAGVAVPLIHQNATIGALGLGFDGPAALGVVDQAFTRLLAQTAAGALHRALSYDEERDRRREAELLAHAREDVLGVVVHDLRNPLNVIGASAQLLREVELGAAERSRMFEVMARALKQMNRLIADLLDTVRIQSGRLSLEVSQVPVVDIVRQAEYTFRPLADAQQIALVADYPDDAGVVAADAGRVSQVLGNLIGNSLKFTPEKGTITLRARPEPRRVLFQVADTGPGIAPENAEKIFQDFWQARRGDSRGIGLGLTIAKALVEAQRGEIWLESTVGAGSTFSFTLPSASA